MKQFKISKAPLNNQFTGIQTQALGEAVGNLKFCGLKLYLYLSSNKDGMNWTLNPSVFAEWLGVDYSNASQARSVRKIISDGIEDLTVNGYLQLVENEEEKYTFSEQKVPKS